MKKTILTVFLVLMVSFSVLFAASLSEETIQKISWVREEEKLARDVYLTLHEQWGLRTFGNIARSEQIHMDSVRDELIIPNGIEDPVKTEEIGVFTNTEIQTIYDELILKGSISIQNAVSVGLLIEDMDIFDLGEVISTVEDETVKEVLEHLQSGSENHMRAFYKQAEKYGVEYVPEYISEQKMNEILAVPSGGGQNSEGNQEHDHDHDHSNETENDNGE